MLRMLDYLKQRGSHNSSARNSYNTPPETLASSNPTVPSKPQLIEAPDIEYNKKEKKLVIKQPESSYQLYYEILNLLPRNEFELYTSSDFESFYIPAIHINRLIGLLIEKLSAFKNTETHEQEKIFAYASFIEKIEKIKKEFKLGSAAKKPEIGSRNKEEATTAEESEEPKGLAEQYRQFKLG